MNRKITPEIEAVARALCWGNGMNPDLTLGGDGENFLWHEYVNQAVRAIRALRVPTNDMLDVGLECQDWNPNTIYTAMIDAALGENLFDT